MKKNSKFGTFVVWLIILVMGGLGIYYFFIAPSDPAVDQQPELLELRVMREDLEDWEIEKWTNDFNLAKEALEQDMGNLEALFRLGRIKKLIGDYAGAEQAYQKILEYEPENGTAYNNLADLYMSFTQQYIKAEDSYHKAIKYSLGGTRALGYYRNLFSLYNDILNDSLKAEATLLGALENYPGAGEMHVLLAKFYRDTGRTEEAIENYKKGLELSENKEAIQRELDELLETLK